MLAELQLEDDKDSRRLPQLGSEKLKMDVFKNLLRRVKLLLK